MGRWERVVVLWALLYIALYFPVILTIAFFNPERFASILPFHFLGMVQNLIALIITIRDLYKRPFPNPNQKVTWALLISWTGGIGWVVYVFKYALKPRVVQSA